MNQEKFQAEPVGLAEYSSQCETAGDNPYLSMLCQVYFNAALNEQNIRFLDQTAPKNSLAFLIKGRCFLHPANYHLFPIEQIESAVRNCGGAICLNNIKQKSPGGEISYKLLFSVINPDENDKIVIGWMFQQSGAQLSLVEMSFANTINEMKRNYNIFKSELRHLQDELSSTTPTIMVDRRNGKIVAANFKAMNNFKDIESNLLNKNFKELIQNSDNRFNLSITNRQSHKEIPAIIKISPTPTTMDNSNSRLEINHKLDNILEATNRLEEQLNDSFENSYDLETIKQETGSLNQLMTTLKQEI